MILKSECYFGNVPEKFKMELVELYESPFCTIEYNKTFWDENRLNCFSICDNNTLVHLILFTIDQHNKIVNILNRLFELDIKYIKLFSDFIFSLKLQIDKIQINHLTNPTLPKQIFPLKFVCKPYDEDYIIKLPSSNTEYFSSLSYHMRNHTQNYISKIERTFGGYSFQFYEKSDIPESVIDKIFEMSYLRISHKNVKWGYDTSYIESLKDYLKHCGFVSVLKINGEIVAGLIMYSIKNNFFFETTSSKPEYDRNNVGHTCFYLSIMSCIEHNGKEIHLLWGNSPYKQRFLAKRKQLYSVTVFRTPLIKLKSKIYQDLLPVLSPNYIYKLLKGEVRKILGQRAINGLRNLMVNKKI